MGEVLQDIRVGVQLRGIGHLIFHSVFDVRRYVTARIHRLTNATIAAVFAVVLSVSSSDRIALSGATQRRGPVLSSDLKSTLSLTLTPRWKMS